MTVVHKRSIIVSLVPDAVAAKEVDAAAWAVAEIVAIGVVVAAEEVDAAANIVAVLTELVPADVASEPEHRLWCSFTRSLRFETIVRHFKQRTFVREISEKNGHIALFGRPPRKSAIDTF